MATQIETLAELQRVDQRLRETRGVVDDARERLAAIDRDHGAKSTVAEAARAAHVALEAQQKTLEERHVALEARMKDRRMRIGRIRNDKELAVLKREVDLAKDEATNVEAELEELYRQIDVSRGALAEAETALAAATAARDGQRSEVAALEARLAAETSREESRRAELLGAIDGSLRQRYETIFARRNGLAVVPIQGGTCRGCHMNVPPQLAIQIQRNEQVILCPSCQRILYWQAVSEESAE